MTVANQVEEGAMHARVVGKFGMKGGSHDSSLPDGDGIAAFGGNDFHVWPYAFNFGCADENHLQGRISQFSGADGAVDLTAVGVEPNAYVERSQLRHPGI